MKGKNKDAEINVKRKPSNPITCRYCETFRHIPDDSRDNKMGSYCKIAKKRISRSSESCRDFELTTGYFRCDVYSQMIALEVCLHRRNGCKYGDYYEQCPKCADGKGLDKFVNGSKVKFVIIGGDDE